MFFKNYTHTKKEGGRKEERKKKRERAPKCEQ